MSNYEVIDDLETRINDLMNKIQEIKNNILNILNDENIPWEARFEFWMKLPDELTYQNPWLPSSLRDPFLQFTATEENIMQDYINETFDFGGINRGNIVDLKETYDFDEDCFNNKTTVEAYKILMKRNIRSFVFDW